MSNNGFYNNTPRGEDLPFFEDTHSVPDYGRNGMRNEYPQNVNAGQNAYNGGNIFPSPDRKQPSGDYTKKTPKNFNNVMVYKPKTETDSKMIIDFIRRSEPAIIDLEKAEPEVSQRILDFVSGAVYALNGTVHRVSGNIFLLSPSGVEVTVPYEVNDD